MTNIEPFAISPFYALPGPLKLSVQSTIASKRLQLVATNVTERVTVSTRVPTTLFLLLRVRWGFDIPVGRSGRHSSISTNLPALVDALPISLSLCSLTALSTEMLMAPLIWSMRFMSYIRVWIIISDTSLSWTKSSISVAANVRARAEQTILPRPCSTTARQPRLFWNLCWSQNYWIARRPGI